MFKRTSHLAIAAAIGTLAAGTAFAGPITVSLTAASGGSTSTVFSGTYASLPPLLSYGTNGNDVNGWNIGGTLGLTSSTIDMSNISVACAITSCNSLTTTLSVSGLTADVGAGGLMQILSGHLVFGSGTVTQWAMIGSSYIGSVNGMSSGGNAQFLLSSTGGTAAAGGTYTLQLIDQFTGCNGSNCVEYSTDGSIVPAPEPGALAIFAAGLLGCAVFINRRRRASRQS